MFEYFEDTSGNFDANTLIPIGICKFGWVSSGSNTPTNAGIIIALNGRGRNAQFYIDFFKLENHFV